MVISYPTQANYLIFLPTEVTHSAERQRALEAARSEWATERKSMEAKLSDLAEEIARKDALLVNAVNDSACEVTGTCFLYLAAEVL